jgi:serine protease Do
MTSKIVMWKGIVLGAVVTGVVSFGFFKHQSLQATPTTEIRKPKTVTENLIPPPQTNQETFEYAAKLATPSVVTVYASTMVKEQQSFNPFDLFRDRQYDRRKQEPREYQQQSSGSGVIVSADGYIVTNNHVVEDVDELTVQLMDKRQFTAKLIGVDPLTDLALIKIEGANLSPIKIGKSSDLALGQQVLAIGNPLQIGLTVTTGIVSALNRNIGIIEDSYAVESFIQTDAVINRGNSGGALVNLKGELIGINSAIFSGTQYYTGYGFAVPTTIVKPVIDALRKEGRVRRGYIGISLSQVDYKIAKANGWGIPKGVYVSQVLENMPAATAGIKQDDIILEVDNVPVNEPNELQVQVSTKNYDANVQLKLFRNGKTLTKTVKLRERTDAGVVQTSNVNKVDIESLGMELQTISKQARDAFDLDKGIEVVNVRRYSEAFDAGLRTGDIILQAGRSELNKVQDLANYIKEREKGDVVKLYVQPHDGKFKRFIYLEIK